MRISKTLFTLPALGLLFFACTSSNDDVDQFVGTWAYNSGSTLSYTCPEGLYQLMLTGSNDQIAHGVETDLVVVFGECTFRGNVTGNKMEWIPGQVCSFMDNGTPGTTTFNSMTYTMADQIQMSMSAAGTHNSSGRICTFTGTGSLRKIAN